MAASDPREHVEEIRRVKFSIGGEPNPLTQDLHHAVRNLSSELYTKDVHFLMELIQNAEDNEYRPDVSPTLEFIFTSEDITKTGAPATLLVINNEVGFSRRNIESICSIGRSTKKGKRDGGFIGEKGIGFKSVFLVTSRPYIFSNGYQIKFDEEPCPDCGIGYIVPQWVDSHGIAGASLRAIYDAHNICGTSTTIILPLKADKVEAVRCQLSEIHPELLLFLTKIKHLSVTEVGHEDHVTTGRLTDISVSNETDFETRESINADSRIVFLTSLEGKNKDREDCNYYLWRQRFPVKPENKAVGRNEVGEWIISLAFPLGERLRSKSPVGIYAFLPTEVVTNLPFIIQADFILSSSRESILLDHKWNIGILECVPTAFVNAFLSMIEAGEAAPISSLAAIFNFLPIQLSYLEVFNIVRSSIQEKIKDELIMPCESFSDTGRSFCKPCDSGRVLPGFRELLHQLDAQKLSLETISSHGKRILHHVIDDNNFRPALNFLGVEYVDCGWYCNVIQGGNFALLSSNDIYLQLLSFVAENWIGKFDASAITEVPLLRCMDKHDNLILCSINSAKRGINQICFAKDQHGNSWMSKWNSEFVDVSGVHFFPGSTLKALHAFPRKGFLLKWLQETTASLTFNNVFQYSEFILNRLKSSRHSKLIVVYTVFLYKSLEARFLYEKQAKLLCINLPIVASCGSVFSARERNELMVPSSGSHWAKLIGPNPWRGEKYIELGDEYCQAHYIQGESIEANQLLPFMTKYAGADDIPLLYPPNAELPVLKPGLSADQAFLLLDWISYLHVQEEKKLPPRFGRSVRHGRWMKTVMGFMPPFRCLLGDGEASSLLCDITTSDLRLPIIDVEFYGGRIGSYRHILPLIGVRCGRDEECGIIGDMILSSSESTAPSKDVAISLMKLVRYLKENQILAEPIIGSLRKWKWLKTTHGYRTPSGSVFLIAGREIVEEIADLAFVDEDFYGGNLVSYVEELDLVGVATSTDQIYHMVARNFALNNSGISKEAAFLICKCIRTHKDDGVGVEFIAIVRENSWLKTSMGFCRPSQSICLSPETEKFVGIASDLAIVDESFYGNCLSRFKPELHQVGVTFDLKEVLTAIISRFKLSLCSSKVSGDYVITMLQWFQDIPQPHYSFILYKFRKSMDEVKWLKTVVGYRSAKNSILSQFNLNSIKALMGTAIMPFVDESYYGTSIYSFRNELKLLGVVVDYAQALKFVAETIVVPDEPAQITAEYMVSILEFIKVLQSDSISQPFVPPLIKTLRRQLWIRTAVGYKLPGETVFPYPEVQLLLNMLKIPVMDDTLYGSRILAYKNELRTLGVEGSFYSLGKKIGQRFVLLSSSSSLADTHVLTLLESCKNLKERKIYLLSSLDNYLGNVKWLKTVHGYRCCRDCVFPDPILAVISQFADIPVLDEAFYGKRINLYMEELKMLAVATGVVESSRFVAEGNLRLSDPLPSNCVISLLQCVKTLVSTSYHQLAAFLNKLKTAMWMKTKFGYRLPEKCLLYDTNWAMVLQQEDAPFIDVSIYGPNLSLYKDELKAIGVVIDPTEACSLVAGCLKSITNFISIKRVYSYFRLCEWTPKELRDSWIWIPENDKEGLWVHHNACLIYDVDKLFNSTMHILSDHYDASLFKFFSSTLGVQKLPAQQHYIELWGQWEKDREDLSYSECCSFWSHFLTSKTTCLRDFEEQINKLPAASDSSRNIKLVDRKNVFIPDVLLLKEMIISATNEPLFVWLPCNTSMTLQVQDMVEAYKVFGVSNVSQAVAKGSTNLGFETSESLPMETNNCLIGEGLIRLVLGFLSNPQLRISTEKRQRKAESILKLEVYETDEPIFLSYRLVWGSKGTTLNVEVAKTVHWEKGTCRLVVQRTADANRKRKLDFAADFAKEISEGLLWKNPELINGLYQLIRTACLLDFDIDAVNTLLKLENLQIFQKDEEFISLIIDRLAANRI